MGSEMCIRDRFIGARNYSKILKYKSNWHTSSTHYKDNFYVDITEYVEKKMLAINEHKSEVNKRGKVWQDYFLAEARKNGIQIGTEFAEAFEIHKWVM